MISKPNHTPREHASQMRPVAEMIFAAISFATMVAIAHGLKSVLPWSTLAFVRVTLTLGIVVAVARYASTPLVFRGPPIMWIRSVVGTLGLICTFYAITHMPITDALTIQHTSPLWVALILAVIQRRLPTVGIVFAIVLGLCGVALMERPAFESSGFVLLVAIGSAFCTGSAVVSLRYLGGYSSLAVVAHYCGMASIATLVISLLPMSSAASPAIVISPTLLWLIPMGFFGTIGQVYMTRAVGKGDTQLISLVALSVIGFAAGYDYLLWGIGLDGTKIAGIALIVAAVAVCSRSRNVDTREGLAKLATDER